MKRTLSTLIISLLVLTAGAIPAKYGTWKKIRLTDGTEVRAQLKGDEFCHYWQTANGQRFIKTANGYQAMPFFTEKAQMQRRAMVQKKRLQRAAKARRAGMRAPEENNSLYTGKKKGLIILAQFQDVKFQEENDSLFYSKFANAEGFNERGFHGSVSDYFKAQSRGKFELDFDVVGPVTVSQNAKYYGENDEEGSDLHPDSMIIEAVTLAKDIVKDWKQYDWANDGEVDQVMVIYAGGGEASGLSDEDDIWPHESLLDLSEYLNGEDKSIKVADGLKVNTYACANEVDISFAEESNEARRVKKIDDDFGYGGYGDYEYYEDDAVIYTVVKGIGTTCHEFSHCLGLPDMYDVYYGGNFGMSDWSLMDQGSHLDIPASYTSHERMLIGWATPKELKDATEVTGMKALADEDDIYIIRNQANENEYYLLENRQKKNWDAQVPASGLLILHVDYDEQLWRSNIVNSINEDHEVGPLNDHQRCTIFHADGQEKFMEYQEKLMLLQDTIFMLNMEFLVVEEGTKEYNELIDAYNNAVDEYNAIFDQREEDIKNDVYPQPENDKLTNTSLPRAFTYNANSDNRKLMNVAITEIKQYTDGTISFKFAPDNSGTEEGDNTTYSKKEEEIEIDESQVIFYESFDECVGTGGNDGKWSGSVANGQKYVFDNEGWAATEDKLFCGDKCIKLGTSSIAGQVTTPEIDIPEEATLVFKAGAWKGDSTNLVLSSSNSSMTITPNELTMQNEAWTELKADLKGAGKATITFTALKRFFLDDVLIFVPEATGIKTVTTQPIVNRIYSIDGRYMGTDASILKPGLYIIGGKKVIK